MALSRSLLWLSPSLSSHPPSLCCQTAERIKLHLLRDPKPKLQTRLSGTLSWTLRGFRNRGFRGELLQVASTPYNDAQDPLGASPTKIPDEDDGAESLTRKPRRRRRTKKKADEGTASSSGKGPPDEALASKSDTGDSSSDKGLAFRLHTDSATGLTSLARESTNGTSGVVGANSGTQELEQSTGVPRKKKRRSKKVKEAGEGSNGTASDVDTPAEQVGRISTDSDSVNERNTISKYPKNPKSSTGAEGLTTEESIASEFSSVTLDNGNESSSPAIKKRKRRAKKKPVLDLERRQGSERKEVENSAVSGVEIPSTDSYSNESNGHSRREGEEQPGPSSGPAIPKTRKRRARRKATSSQDLVAGSSEPAENDSGGDSSGKDPSFESSLDDSTLTDDGKEDELSKATILKNSQKSLQEEGDEAQPSMPKGRTGSGTVTENSGDVQMPAADAEGAEAAMADDSAKPVKKAKRRRQRKKKAPSSLPAELAQAEVAAPNADDLYESIVWCTVHLKVQAELEENERLYVVGANPELGGWDLSQALPLPESDEEGVWGNTLKIPRGTMLEYKYFTESEDTVSADIQRWFGPEVQYFLPWKEGQGSEVEVVRDTWIPDVPSKLPLLSWGDRWWEDLDSKNEDEFGHQDGQNGEDQLNGFGKALSGEEEALDFAERTGGPPEEPVVEEWLRKKIRRKVFPREEPWLLESMIMDQRNGSARKRTEDFIDGFEGGAEAFDSEHKEADVQVEILINSPQCTMQRMAILEDSKLVELLVEPVNTRVQVGNLYLGVVRQLLPGMTGVFVDIGGFQLALLDITRNQYPYTFPSIGQAIDIAPGDGQTSWGSLEEDEESDWERDGEEDDEDEEDHDGEFGDEEDEGDEEELEEEEAGGDVSRGRPSHSKGRGEEDLEGRETRADLKGRRLPSLARTESGSPGPITVNFGRKLKKWRRLQEGMQIIVQVKKEAFGKKGPRLTAFPSLAGRFWVLIPGGNAVGVSRRITGPERKRLRQLAQDLLPANFSLTVRTEAVGLGREELEKDLARLIETWKEVLERASAAALAAEHGMEGAMPVLLHRAMGQFLTIVRDFFNDKVHRMVIDSPQCYQEITSYLQEVAPQLCDRVELYAEKMPLFDAFAIEPEIEKFSNRRVSLPSGGYLVLEETEALVSIDVNGGTGVLSHDVSQEDAILAVNLAAARQIATELRLRDIGGIIVVDFIDMGDPRSEKMVLDEMRKAVARDRSSPSLSEISEFGLMEMTRKRVRPSVTLTISDACTHCSGVGRVEAHETTLSKIERAILRLLATGPGNGDTRSSDSTKWPQVTLRVDNDMGEYLKGRKRKRMTQLSAALKVWLNLKVVLEFNTGQFQVFEQHRMGSEKRSNGTGQSKSNQQNVGPGLLGKRGGVWPGKRRRNFASQGSTKE